MILEGTHDIGSTEQIIEVKKLVGNFCVKAGEFCVVELLSVVVVFKR